MKRKLRRIPQRDWANGDCGLACVAMVAGVSYEEALGVFRGLDRPNENGFYTRYREIEEMLTRLGCVTRRRHFRSWKHFDQHAIVKVNLCKSGTWHWVVFDAARASPTVHDPKPGKRSLITKFNGLKGAGCYIAIVE